MIVTDLAQLSKSGFLSVIDERLKSDSACSVARKPSTKPGARGVT